MALMISWVMPVNPSHPYLENDPAPSFALTICAFHLGFSLATGEVSRERWYLLTSLGSRQWGPRELLRLFRNHWSVENSLHHVKDRSWDEDVHTLRRPGLGEIFATLVNTGLNDLRLEGWFHPGCPCPCEPRPVPSANADYRPPLRSSFLSLQSSWYILRNCSDFVGSERSPKRRNWQSSYERPLPLNGYSERSPQL